MGSNAVDVLMGGGHLEVDQQELSDQGDSADQGGASNEELPASSYSPIFVSQYSSPVPSTRRASPPRTKISIVAPTRNLGDEYKDYHEPVIVTKVVTESLKSGKGRYLVKFTSGENIWISQEQLIALRGGTKALGRFREHSPSESYTSTNDSETIMVATRQKKAARRGYGDFVDSSTLHLSSDDELNAPQNHARRARPKRGLLAAAKTTRRSQVHFSQPESSGEESSSGPSRRRSSRRGRDSVTVNYIDTLPDEDSEEGSDGKVSSGRKRKRASSPPRRSERSRRGVVNMREIGEDELPERPTDKPSIKVVGARENFQRLPKSDEFRLRHLQTCDTCGDTGDHDSKGHLIYCQGCSMSYHLQCLGVRSTRDHLVTKIGHQDFVLQCRRCVEIARTRDPLAPRQGRCQRCRQDGSSCKPFRERKTMLQEQKDREDNADEDPSIAVPSERINNPKNVLFRCAGCFRAFHFHHLPSRSELRIVDDGGDSDEEAEKRIREYCKDWVCNECAEAPAKIEALVAWRPIDQEAYAVGTSTEQMEEDDKEYLVKWHELSYHQSSWQPGAWVWGNTAPQMRKAFAKRDNGTNLPKMTYEDAIPEDWLRVDIIFDVKYTNLVKTRVLEIDLARVNEVGKALVKYKGLSYEDTVWEAPPDTTDTERWEDFKTAYDDWVHARYIRPPVAYNLKKHLTSLRAMNFGAKVELKDQPDALTGGKLMKYQLDGMNWLLFQWYKEQNAILADEMGLGKTIQVIAFLAALQSKHRCWPFLIVVPDATCANWRREIKQWAPSLRVVMFFGSSKARELALKHELFPEGAKELRCHIVVTSYNTAQDEANQKIFRRVSWAGLVVDEGQRLKREDSLLYTALNSLKIPFRLLLTGTPLQNTQRELFNLLQFLDNSINAEELQEKYPEINKDNAPEIHELIRPFFLRRTKAQVLTFLPPVAQIIVPLSLSPLQKELYKSVLAKNADLLHVIFGTDNRKTFQKVTGLKNLLMQLRKCLCHPFVYSIDIEEKSSNEAVSHKGLVEASSKLRLLELMLPKLQERGHRVLIFSQFLDMLTIIEDFLDGLGLAHLRIDGSMSSMQKQKKIDEYNAPDSPIFACLLSTRAGGVGINLATADTVIILDPDFNPHQDIQALSRAHRIGQKNKVLVFQLMTRKSAEERIMQLSKKKLALEQVLIEQMETLEPDGNDLESVLRFGTEALFKDDGEQDIVYDSASVDRLLDRSQIENTDSGIDKTAESQFSFARVWANDTSNLENSLGDTPDEGPADPTVWDKILAERARQVELEKTSKAEALGRGKRQRRNLVDLSMQNMDDILSPLKGHRKPSADSDDEEFEEYPAESEGEESAVEDNVNDTEKLGDELKDPAAASSRSRYIEPKPEPKVFQRAIVRSTSHVTPQPTPQQAPCFTCSNVFGPHRIGWCPLKVAGVERCNLCGMPHYGIARTCPHLQDEIAVRTLIKQLGESPEPEAMKAMAKRYLRGILGNLVQKQKQLQQNEKNGVAQTNGLPSLETLRASGHARDNTSHTYGTFVPAPSVHNVVQNMPFYQPPPMASYYQSQPLPPGGVSAAGTFRQRSDFPVTIQAPPPYQPGSLPH